MVHAGPKLISHSPLPFDSSSLQFEVVEGGDLLRYALSAAVDACADSWRFSKSWLGLIPRNSIIGKLPYYRASVAQRPGVLPPSLKWVLDTQAAIQEQQRQQVEQELAEAALQEEDTASASGASLVASPAPAPAPAAPAPAPAPALARPRRRRYVRDLATRPSMIPIYNVLLVWALFNIDIRASAL